MTEIEFMYELWRRNLLTSQPTITLTNEKLIRVCDNDCEACFSGSSQMYEICKNAGIGVYINEEIYDEFFEKYPEAKITM